LNKIVLAWQDFSRMQRNTVSEKLKIHMHYKMESKFDYLNTNYKIDKSFKIYKCLILVMKGFIYPYV